ncbi:MAG: hypothetical protein KGY74_11140 [Candidatus Cloacimonetes bacterium]|nr:hypothetical protein [Candidatus Cloacimonadota bacterium]
MYLLNCQVLVLDQLLTLVQKYNHQFVADNYKRIYQFNSRLSQISKEILLSSFLVDLDDDQGFSYSQINLLG